MLNKTIEKLLNKAYFYLYLRQRSEKEVLDYLKKKAGIYHATEEDIEHVMDKLRDQHYIDDDAFLESYIRYQTATKPKGEYALRLILLKKGISEEKINAYFESHTLNEKQLAKEILQKILLRYKNLDPQKRKKRAIDFLSRRGFSFDTALEAVEIVEKKG